MATARGVDARAAMRRRASEEKLTELGELIELGELVRSLSFAFPQGGSGQGCSRSQLKEGAPLPLEGVKAPLAGEGPEVSGPEGTAFVRQ